jgi:hypothetical protein
MGFSNNYRYDLNTLILRPFQTVSLSILIVKQFKIIIFIKIHIFHKLL